MATQPKPDNMINGINLDEFFHTINTVKAKPTLASFNFRIRNQWMDAGFNRSTITNYSVGAQDIPHQQTFLLEADEPPTLLGVDQAANPVEYLLHALAACVTTSMVYHAAARGIHIEEVESTVSGDIDLRGFLGLNQNIRNGFQGIRMNFKIKADAPRERIQDICQLGQNRSPVFDSLTKGVPVTVHVEPM